MAYANPDVQFEAGGKAWTLRFSARALAALQDHWGLENLDQVAQKLVLAENGGLGIYDHSAMLWAALRTHHRETTLDNALDIIDEIGLPEFEKLISQAIAAAASKGGGGSAPENPPAGAKRGRSTA